MTKPATLDEARNAKPALLAALAGDARVNGVGLGYDPAAGYLLKVNVTVPEAADVVPAVVAGVPVRTEVVGTIRPQ
ncbi:MAG: hypothetical protein H0V64_10585 [Geodermatophilaceae bacterium]|jgi:hypothetical protein|nr:hypothetical protein [Geodermatophilaceae bacterium]MDQ3465457.1 hypothetical protein [Actinomycetota bacterium]